MPQHHPVVTDRKVAALRQAMGPVIAGALADRLVVEVMVNPDGKIWVDKIGEGRSWTGELPGPPPTQTAFFGCWPITPARSSLATSPRISATLPITGERFQGAFMPVVASPAFAIRKRPEVVFTLAEYVEKGIMTVSQAEVIREAAVAHQNILIVGGTGSGKTTLANAILAEPAFAADRVVLIEDTAELQSAAADKVAMLTKRTDPPVTMTDLVRDTLRLRPDRIIIGEVRDGSALDLLKAWNTGHPGGLATIHANSAAEAPDPPGGSDRRGDAADPLPCNRPGHQCGGVHRADRHGSKDSGGEPTGRPGRGDLSA